MEKVEIRKYRDSDKAAVLKLFQLNTPPFFSPEEGERLVYYLENEIEGYFVLEFDGQVVGCGGINFEDKGRSGIISWDIFHPDFQRRNLGSTLLRYRIEKLKAIKEIRLIIVRTSQFTWKFYEKQGFVLKQTKKDYWANGFDLYDMEYVL